MVQRNLGVRAPRQGPAESVGMTGLPGARMVAASPGFGVGDAVRSLLASTAAGLAAAGQISDRRYAAAVRDETDRAVAAVMRGDDIRESLTTREAVDFYDRAHAQRLFADFDPAAVAVGEGQTPGEALSAHLASEYAGLPETTQWELFRRVMPPFVNHIHRQRQQAKGILYADGAAALAGRGADDPDREAFAEDLTEHLRLAEAMDAPRARALADVLVPAMDAAARRGDADRVAFLGGLTEGLLPHKVQAAADAAETNAAARAYDRHVAAIDAMTDPIAEAAGVTAAIAADDALSPPQRVRLRESAERRVGGEVAAMQHAAYERVKTDILYGRREPEEIAAEIHDRGLLDADDPGRLAPNQVQELWKLATAVEQQDVAKQLVAAKLSAGLPLSAADGTPLLALQAEQRHGVTTVVDDNGNHHLVTLDNPVAYAASCAAAGIVPRQAADHIRAGLGSEDGQAAARALVEYAALHAASPQAAASVRDGMSDLAALRADFVTDRRAAPAGDLDALTADVEAMLPAVMRLRPLEMTAPQIDALVWLGDAAAFADEPRISADAADALTDALPGELQSRWGFWFWGQSVEEPPTAMLNTYRGMVRQRFAQHVSQGMSEDAAADKAKAEAATLALRRHPPVLWTGSRVYFTRNAEGLTLHEHYGKLILADLQALLKDSWDDADEIAAAHRPAWDPHQQAFFLVDEEGEPWTYSRDGRTITFYSSPFIPSEPPDGEDLAKLQASLLELGMVMQETRQTGAPEGMPPPLPGL